MVPTRALTHLAAAVAVLALASVAVDALWLATVVAAASVAGLAIVDWRAARHEPPPEVERVLPSRVRRGQACAIVYRVSHALRRPVTMTVLDELPQDVGGDLLIEEIALGPGEQEEIRRSVQPTRRGRHPLGPTYVAWRSSLGLFWRRSTLGHGGELSVFASPSVVRHGALTHRSVATELGLRPRRPRGDSTEFESLRDYVPGDDPRHLDWRATARRGRMIVRQHQIERQQTIVLAVDTGRLMAAAVDTCSKLDHALDCSVTLATAARRYGDHVGLVAFDRELRALVHPTRGAHAVLRMLEATVGLEPARVESSYRTLVETLAEHQRKRALVLVLTDFVEVGSRPLEAHLGVLARRHCVLLVALRDRLFRTLETPPATLAGNALYERLALQDLALEREEALSRIRRAGVQTLDLDPAELTEPVLNRYLAIRAAGLL